MPFVEIIPLKRPDGESTGQQSRYSNPPCYHLRHTNQPGRVSFPEREEGDFQKHPLDLNPPLSGAEGRDFQLVKGLAWKKGKEKAEGKKVERGA